MERFLIWAVLVLALCGPAAGYTVSFDQTEYRVEAFDRFDVQLLFDADESIPGFQPIAGGLFSMGVRVMFGAGGAEVAAFEDIILPTPINSDGLGGDPLKEIVQDAAAASGAVSLFASEGYLEALLVTFVVTDPGPGKYGIAAAPFFYDTRANFLDSQGAVLDDEIAWGSAVVVSIPEPVTVLPVVVGIALAWRRRR